MVNTIFAERLFTGESVLDKQLITCSEGKILSIAPANGGGDQQVYALAAGFNDIHINGGSRWYLTKDPTVETVHDIAVSCAALGTAYTLPTLITSPPQTIFKGIEAVKQYMAQHPSSGVIGVHLEGPFLHPAKRGAHLPEFLQKPDTALLREIVHAGKDVIRMITIAPELFTDEQLAILLDSGITVSAGHSNATYEQAQAAFKKGIGVCTHLYNAMSGFGHREPGLVGAVLDNGHVYAPIILDGVHCHYAAARVAHAAKKDTLFLISDALFTGGEVQHFQWGNYEAFLRNGKYINSEGNLSGSSISLADAVCNAITEVGIDAQEAVEMATIRPATALGIADKIGRVQPGYPAEFTTFNSPLTRFTVIRY